MDAIRDFFHLFFSAEGLTRLIEWGGLTGLTAIVFAETGLLIGFFLPGDTLLFTAGPNDESHGLFGALTAR